jgi:choline dehydrogenase-like flavoprotein
VLDVLLVVVLVLFGARVVELLLGSAVEFSSHGGEVDIDMSIVLANALVATGISASYFVLSWHLFRASPGQRILGLRLCQAADGEALSWRMALVRWFLLFPPFVLLALIAGSPVMSVLIWGCAPVWYLVLLVTTVRDPIRRGRTIAPRAASCGESRPMFVDAHTVPTDARLEADLCIIGAGAAGITITRKLIGTPVRVAVLESGGLEPDERTQALCEGPQLGIPYEPLIATRLRYFGGTTGHWGGLCRPFDEIDFQARPSVRYSGWPIGLADVRPFYPEAAGICGVSSPQRWDLQEWAARDRFAPLPFDERRIISRVAQVASKDLRRFGDTYRNELERAGNVTVFLHANVTSIQTDAAGTTATSVRVATLDGQRFTLAARQVVLAAGAIENARLLLVSNERWPAGLGNGNDLVGRFFQEHPRFVAGVIEPSHPRIPIGFYANHHVAGSSVQSYLSPSPQIQMAEGRMDVQLRLTPMYDERFAAAERSPEVASLRAILAALEGKRSRGSAIDLGRHVRNVLEDLGSWERFVIPEAPVPVPYPHVLETLWKSSRLQRRALIPSLLGDIAAVAYNEYVGAPIQRVLVVSRIEQVPNPDSRVLLLRERDALGMPRAACDARLSEADRRNDRRALELFGAEVGRMGLGRLKLLSTEDETEWPGDLNGGAHLMGTTRMSDDPKEGVIDRNCRVHGMANLYIAGSSIFPTGGSGTPTMTLVALALRLAQHLRSVLT